jgi:hypothetical protein
MTFLEINFRTSLYLIIVLKFGNHLYTHQIGTIKVKIAPIKNIEDVFILVHAKKTFTC